MSGVTTVQPKVKVIVPFFSRLDIAGAFGDIGILFPISIALITLNGLNPTAVFLSAGLTYILAGWYFRIPIAVQPLKAVAAIALATGLPPSSLASAGLLMGVLLALIGLTNGASWLARLFTLPIVRGIQLGLGLLLVREGLRLIFGRESALVLSNSMTLTGWEIGVGAAVILLILKTSSKYPAALVLLALGIALGLIAHGENLPELHWGVLPLSVMRPRVDELKTALVLLVIPQFALTFGNSIIATENTAQILYGSQARRVTLRGLTLSIALVNLVSGIIQASPLCHGSGGVTAHYKFGARSQKSSYIMGGVCLLLALLGRAAVGALSLIPVSVLGAFLIYVGVQHANYLRDIIKQKALLGIALCIGVISLVTTNLMWGFLTGFLLHGSLNLFDKSNPGKNATPEG